MDWNKGFSTQYYACFVDALSWRDTERFEIVGGNTNRSDDALRQSASLECKDYPESIERWVRVYLIARQGEESVREPLFTGLATTPGDSFDGIVRTNSLECYSVLKPAEDVLLDRGWYAPAGQSGADIIRQLLSATPAPVVVDENAPVLQGAIIAEDGETYLSMVDKVLMAIDWRLRIEGDGTIHICPKATSAAVRYDAIENDAIEPEIDIEQDLFGCPNVFRAVQDDLSAVARDDAEDSAFSTVNRGREIWREETSCNLNTGETIAEYALRRLKEEQTVAVSAKYNRRFYPDLIVSDYVHLNYQAQGMSGLYRIESQTMDFEYGGRTSEEVVRV